jgi:tripartite-type tricarboxylate transporter receptor subunit TctC
MLKPRGRITNIYDPVQGLNWGKMPQCATLGCAENECRRRQISRQATKDQGGFAMRSHAMDARKGRLRISRAAVVIPLAAIAGTIAHERARSESTFPAKPIQIFIPYGAGGVADLTMRLLAQKLTERTKQQVVIENRPGAGGLLSAKEVLRAPSDGYTLGVIGNGQAIGMTLFKTRPYNVLTDFTFVSITARFEMLLAVKADSPLKTLDDVAAAARKDPGKLNFGAINPGSTQNLSAHLFKQVSGVEVAIVPYKTTPDLVTAVLRGDIDVGFDFYAGLQALISDNQVRIIATSGEQRNPLLRDVPTARESGFPEYVVTSWNGLAAAAGMRAETLAILNQHINAALSDSTLQATASTLGMDARGSTPEEMRERMAADVQKWAAVIEKAGIPKQ